MARKPLKNDTSRKPLRKQSVEPVATAAAAAAPEPTTSVAMTEAPRLARMRRATASPAQRRGADLVRWLRLHRKHPYGKRGEEAIVRLAVEVGHLANLELNAPAGSER